jgi:hypothetical protein
MKRETRIEKMVSAIIDWDSTDGDYLEDVLINGFKGYNNMTDSELLKEYKNYRRQYAKMYLKDK